jgi:hypothetical protein
VISFYKKKYGLTFALVILCGFQFFFLPFIHFHPDNTHSHHTELSPHHHPGHFHSHELESLTHLIKSSEASHEEEHHHSENFDDTDSITLHKPKLEKGSSIVKIGNANSYFLFSNSDLSSSINPDRYYKKSSGLLKSFIARSPPAFLI